VSCRPPSDIPRGPELARHVGEIAAEVGVELVAPRGDPRAWARRAMREFSARYRGPRGPRDHDAESAAIGAFIALCRLVAPD
jgi:hypothetical protein